MPDSLFTILNFFLTQKSANDERLSLGFFFLSIIYFHESKFEVPRPKPTHTVFIMHRLDAIVIIIGYQTDYSLRSVDNKGITIKIRIFY